MFSKKLSRILTTCLVAISIVLISPQASEALSAKITDMILAGNYENALNSIENNVSEPDERIFAKAYVAFRREKFEKARTLFKQVTNQHPESPRVVDATYFLDRLKMRIKKLDPPNVKVLLTKGNQLFGSLTGTTKVLSGSGNSIGELRPGEKWRVEVNQGKVQFSIKNRKQPINVSPPVIFNKVKNGHLAYDNNRYRGKFKIIIQDGKLSLINDISIKKYLYGVVRKEIAPGWPLPVVKAQAISARSFALKAMQDDESAFDIGSGHLSQVYGGFEAENKRIRQAVEETSGIVLTYDNRVVPGYFHANSGGYIETAESVWNKSKTPFIVPKNDEWSRETSHSNWTSTLTLESVKSSIRESDLPAPDFPINLQKASSLPSGRAKEFSYNSTAGRVRVQANELRLALGPSKIKSTWVVDIQKHSNEIIIKGRGWGHGVGLSQWGAKAMAEAGHSYKEILSFYYEKATLMGRYGVGKSVQSNIIP